MVVRVRLVGLNITKARGRWYVYPRKGGKALISGFDGTRDQLLDHMASPNFMQTYNRPRVLSRPAADFGSDTLGGLVHWYTNGDLDRDRKQALAAPGALAAGYPKWRKLSKATRADYLDAFEYLRFEFDIMLADIRQPDLYDLRDGCANKKWPRFADQMIAALSSAFRQGVKRGKMEINPCLGMDKAHQADPNSNREWFADELPAAIARAPMEVKIALMLARYAGLRGQTVVDVTWKQRFAHPLTGSAIRLTTAKNNERNFLPELPELQEFLATIKVRTKDGKIALRDNGQPWKDEKEMQTRVSHFLRDLEREGVIGAGTTLHGLRVSYAAWWKRSGASDGEVADLLGDKSEAMGKHYTRHVEREVNVIRAFDRLKDRP